MFTWKTYFVETQRRADEATKAQQANFEGHIMMHSTPSNTITDRVLALLGAQLIAWGIHLQSHYADITAPTQAQNVHYSALDNSF